MARLIGPSCAVPSMSAGGAVGGPLALNLDIYVRIYCAESLRPEGHEVVQRVRAHTGEIP